MLSENEYDYLLGLINVYKKQGYNYYLCSTISNRDIDYDFIVYFSKNEIKDLDSLEFLLEDAVVIQINSNSYNTDYNKIPVKNIVNVSYSGSVKFTEYDYIYTNAVYNTSSSYFINPDVSISSSSNYELLRLSYVNCLLLGIIFIYIFVKSLLRLKR
jgi:hypothetical protein